MVDLSYLFTVTNFRFSSVEKPFSPGLRDFRVDATFGIITQNTIKINVIFIFE